MGLRRKKTPEELDAAARRKDEKDRRRMLRLYKKHVRDGFIIIRSAEGATATPSQVQNLRPARANRPTP